MVNKCPETKTILMNSKEEQRTCKRKHNRNQVTNLLLKIQISLNIRRKVIERSKLHVYCLACARDAGPRTSQSPRARMTRATLTITLTLTSIRVLWGAKERGPSRQQIFDPFGSYVFTFSSVLAFMCFFGG